MTKEEKKKSAEDILRKAIKDCTIKEEDDKLFIVCEHDIKDFIYLLKSEFFVLIKPVCEEADEKNTGLFCPAENYIRENYFYESLSARVVAEYLNVTRSHLESEFLKETNSTVTEYIRKIRCKKASELLVHDVKSEETAYLCGFGSVKTMQRAFKSVYGKTPGEFKKGKA